MNKEIIEALTDREDKAAVITSRLYAVGFAESLAYLGKYGAPATQHMKVSVLHHWMRPLYYHGCVHGVNWSFAAMDTRLIIGGIEYK